MNRILRALIFALGAGLSLCAQPGLETAPARRVYFDGALLLGVPTGSLRSDITSNPAWGLRLGLQIPATPRLSFRVSGEDLFFVLHDVDYFRGSTRMNQEVSFNSLRVGVDLLYEPRGARAGGPYAVIGGGSQYSDLTTTISRYRYWSWFSDREELGEGTRASRTNAYLAAGAGWRWHRTYLELRVFNVAYDASAGRPAGTLPRTDRDSLVVEAALGCRL